jgi:hypothetical protein
MKTTGTDGNRMDFDRDAHQKLHTRDLRMTTYAYRQDAILLEGRLIDERYCPSYNLFGEQRPAGIIHDMIVRMIISGPKLVIEDLEAQMVTVPNPECREVLDSLLPLKGERITGGFTARVHQLVGGPSGCAHLVALSRAMASAAVQGAYAAISRQAPPGGIFPKRSLQSVINTCHIWRSDGPLMKKLDLLSRQAQDKP